MSEMRKRNGSSMSDVTGYNEYINATNSDAHVNEITTNNDVIKAESNRHANGYIANNHANSTMSDTHANGFTTNTHVKGVASNKHENGFITNGYHEYHQSDGPSENIGAKQSFLTFLDTQVLPVFLLLLIPQIAMLYWYTNAHCNGSYLEMLSQLHVTSMVKVWSDISIVNSFTVGVVFGYFAWALFWMVALPGKTVYGPVTPSGHTPAYKDNGFLHYAVTMAGFAVLTVVLKMNGMSPSVVYDGFGELLAFMNVFAMLFVLFLYFKGIYAPSTKDSGKSGSGFLFDYYWGTELYPRIFGIDVKVLTNCRFGMTVWPLLVCIYAIKSYELHGFVDSMAITTILQLTYITKFFTWEAGYMCTIDIILDRAGFYICWGCFCYLPSLYPLASQYLVSRPRQLGTTLSFIILALGLFAIFINYLADIQKLNVRKFNGDCLVWGKVPKIIRAKYKTKDGEQRESILLASGWWGLSRHFHYIPELLVAFLWTVPSGFGHLLPYSYLVFLLILLIHRSFRDDEKCSEKYGVYWQQYCSKVKYKIIPYVF